MAQVLVRAGPDGRRSYDRLPADLRASDWLRMAVRYRRATSPSGNRPHGHRRADLGQEPPLRGDGRDGVPGRVPEGGPRHLEQRARADADGPDRLDAREFLPVDELQRVACSDSCPGLFAQLREVYLFGCNTLDPQGANSASADVVRSLVPDFYDRAVRQAGISPVLVEIPPLERVKIKKDAPFTFTATVEIKPKIELRDYKAPNPISLKPDKRTVTDEQLARGMDVLREQHARFVHTVRRPRADGQHTAR